MRIVAGEGRISIATAAADVTKRRKMNTRTRCTGFWHYAIRSAGSQIGMRFAGAAALPVDSLNRNRGSDLLRAPRAAA